MFVESQDIGKYAYSSKDFTLTSFMTVLILRPNNYYDVDLSDMYEGVGYWHINIGALLGGKSSNPSDLTFLAYRTADAIAVNFGDQGLTLTRVGYDYFPATFVYLTTDEPQRDPSDVRQ
ncbi:hypothetical protein FOZ62_032178 [Perkinsus olseni]|uniref:Uncharacterized protein n=1 Tax=Perkinsus olseni TaxID=32597 RepID=A0A7J6Q930_PEROL|nr:hypothetical protein FOZ62_032178 [Perkinsus olseni]